MPEVPETNLSADALEDAQVINLIRLVDGWEAQLASDPERKVKGDSVDDTLGKFMTTFAAQLGIQVNVIYPPGKSLVRTAHAPGPFDNGFDGCHARGSNGMCTGRDTAAWLNALGEDSEQYGSTKNTNGAVRKNWVRGSHHIEWDKK